MVSILSSIKNLLGIETSDTSFDTDIIFHINSAFSYLFQLGVPYTETAFSISDATATWASFLGTRTDLDAVKSYVYLRVKLLFDPPQNSFLVESINRQITEAEWRLNVISEGDMFVPVPEEPEEE